MPAQIGRKMTVRRDGVIIAGVQEKSMTLNNEPVDTTSDDDEGFRSMLSDPAIKSMSIAVSGVTKDAGLRAQAIAGENLIFDNISLVFEDGSYVFGDFFFANYEESGTTNEAVKFSASLENAGPFELIAAEAPENQVLPAISGVAQVGQVLTCWPGEWDGFGTVTYQWQVNGGSWTNISGAVARTYTPITGQIGNPLRCVVGNSNSAGSGSATSVATANVIAA